MKKSLLTIVLAVVLAVCSLGLVACTPDTDPDKKSGLQYKKYQGDEYYTVYDYIAEDGVEVLDLGAFATEKGIEIGRIQTGAFDGNESLTELKVPTTVKEMDAGALAGMRKLEKLTIPFVGNTVNADAFYGQTEAAEDKSVDFERTFGYIFGSSAYKFSSTQKQNYDGKTENVKTYYVPMTLKEVTVAPANDYNVPMYAFNGNTVLTTVNFNDKVIGIGENAFEGCTALATISGNASVATIYKAAFKGCKNLKAISGYTALTEIKESAFENAGLQSVEMVASITYGANVFKGSAVTSASISTDVPSGCFNGCSKLTTVTVNADVTFNDFSFANITSVLNINQGSYNVTKIANWKIGSENVNAYGYI